MLINENDAKFKYCPLLKTHDDKMKFCQGAMCRSERCSTVSDRAPASSTGRISCRIVKRLRSITTP